MHRIELRQAPPSETLQFLEDGWRGTEAVALARGYRLHLAELALAAGPPPEDQLLPLLSPLPSVEGAGLTWLAEPDRDTILAWGDRWVLEAWLDGPGVPLAEVHLDAFSGGRLLESPWGALVEARARGAVDPDARDLADLWRATELALQEAAADRDSEQREWHKTRAAVAEELAVEDPVAHLLASSAARLTRDAGTDRSAGAAVLALQALRLHADDGGLDRVDGLVAASRWHDDLAPLVQVWRVIALERAIERVDAAHDTALGRRAVADLADALYGTGARPLGGELTRPPSPPAWGALGRSLGVQSTSWEQLRPATGQVLAHEAELAATLRPELAETLRRVARRAP